MMNFIFIPENLHHLKQKVEVFETFIKVCTAYVKNTLN